MIIVMVSIGVVTSAVMPGGREEAWIIRETARVGVTTIDCSSRLEPSKMFEPTQVCVLIGYCHMFTTFLLIFYLSIYIPDLYSH